MATLTAKWVYTNNQAATITIASLSNFGIALSNTIDNTTTGYMSMDLQLQITTSFAVADGGLYRLAGVGLYLLRTTDGNTSGVFDTVLGPGLSITTANTIKGNNPELLQILYTPAAATAYKSSIRIENLPGIFKFMIYNATGGPLDSTGSNHYLKYNAKTLQVV